MSETNFSPSLGSLNPLDHFGPVALPLLILGMPGVPGYNAFYFFRKLFGDAVFGLTPLHAQELNGPGIISAEAENFEALKKVFDDYQFASIVDASGWCALKSAEYNVELARKVNVDIGENVMRLASERGCKLIRLSTDLVFDGLPYEKNGVITEGNYTEEWPVSPVTVYGKMMALAENKILSGYPAASVLRISLPMGPSWNGHAGAIDWIESRFRKNSPATLYFDEVRSSLYVQDLNQVLLYFLTHSHAGIYHVGGPLALSLYQIAQVINRLGNYQSDLLMGCPRAEAGPMPPRAGHVGMDISKVTAILPLGTLNTWPLSAEQIPTDKQWHAPRNALFPKHSISKLLYGYAGNDHPEKIIPKTHPWHIDFN